MDGNPWREASNSTECLKGHCCPSSTRLGSHDNPIATSLRTNQCSFGPNFFIGLSVLEINRFTLYFHNVFYFTRLTEPQSLTPSVLNHDTDSHAVLSGFLLTRFFHFQEFERPSSTLPAFQELLLRVVHQNELSGRHQFPKAAFILW